MLTLLVSAFFTVAALVLCLPLLFRVKKIKSFKNYIVTKLYVHSFLKSKKGKFATCVDLHRSDLTPVDLGILPSDLEYDLDNPRKESLQCCDGIHFMGVSSEEQMIDVCINRIEENMALIWVYLKLSNGYIYELPSTDTRKAYISNQNMFSSSGLQIKCLSPLRKWRISFNGLLKKSKSAAEDFEVVHCKFSFIWLAMSLVNEVNLSYEEKTLSKAFTEENHIGREKDLMWLYELQNKYEQWGQLMGTIAFKEETEKDLYFWSMRTRISDSPAWNESLESLKFVMYFRDGIPLKIETLSINNILSNLNCGFSVSPAGAIRQISDCDFGNHLLKKDQKKTQFSFILNQEKKNIQVHFIGGKTEFLVGPQLQFKLSIRPFRMQMKDSDGFGILHHLSKSHKNSKPFQYPPMLLKDPAYPSCPKSFLAFEEDLCHSSLISGGKGSSLALLTDLAKKTKKFVVPRGFVISTKAFQDHLLSDKNLMSAVQGVKDVAYKINKGNLKTECDKCVSIFSSTKLSEALKNEINKTLLNVYDSLEDIKFSIRSSAVGEDSEELSAAGQMLTVLGVRGIDNIFHAVVQCWASKFGFEAVQYARQNGQSVLSPMAVVIQEMVPSSCSGVLFTVDPVTGDASYPYISANFGLGETVVSALADPDTIVLSRESDNSLKVFKTNLGTKRSQVFLKTEGGLEEKNSEDQSEKLCLTNDWAIKLGEVGILVESCFCNPRDIEWAIYKDHLYLLQARPITTLHSETDFELIHDQDTPTRSVNDFWTRANTGEVFLGATSPLGISIVVGGMDLNSHRANILREKRINEFCPYFLHILPVTHRQTALNIVDALFRSNEKEITVFQKAFEVALFGRAVITDEIHQAGIKKYGYASRKHKYGFIFIPLLMHSMQKSIFKFDKALSMYKLPSETFTTAKKTFEGILNQINFYCEVCGVHGMTTFLSSFFNMMLITVLCKGKKEWDTELYSDFATLLSSCSGVESADVPESLQELAKSIALSEGSTFSSLPVQDAYNLLKNSGQPCGKLFKKFIEKHGHRCVAEFDVYSKSWGMQPESLIPTIQNIVRALNPLNVATKEVLDTEAIISRIKTPLSFVSKILLKFLLPKTRKYVALREKTKSMTIKTVDWLRISCYRLGDLMTQEGFLPESELVFFLTLEEIKDVLDSQKPGLVPKAIRRKRLHQHLNELKFPEIMKGIPKPIEMKRDNSAYVSSFTLKGTPVCQGTVKAKAVVVLKLEEASKIESGDILITYSTDIGWSPYFPLLSGVVTVLGGLISHGAVVAREFGLPCVVGVANATVAFNSGDIVLLNGTRGTVTKIIENSNSLQEKC